MEKARKELAEEDQELLEPVPSRTPRSKKAEERTGKKRRASIPGSEKKEKAEDSAEDMHVAPETNASPRKGKKRRQEEENEDVAATPDDDEKNADDVEKRKSRKEKKRRRRQQESEGISATEEDGEVEEPAVVAPACSSTTANGEKKKERAAAVGVIMDPAEWRSAMQVSSKNGVVLPDPVQTFDKAPFGKNMRNALMGAGFTTPTPIQAQGWPVAMGGNDLVAVAKTGSGKTLAFLLPAFRKITKEQLDGSEGPVCLVLAPTRELAMQIEVEAVKFAACVGVRCQVVYGGVPKPPQAKALQRSKRQVLVATPGRLVDLMGDGVAKLGSVQFLVLDEADRMLDMGFLPQMEQIMQQVPSERQTLLFTATWPKPVQKLAASYLKKTKMEVNVGETVELAANKAISQEFYALGDDEKENRLWKIMDELSEDAKVIVFANTKRRIVNLQKQVWSSGYNCVALHGDIKQAERDASYAEFVSGKSPVMFATDVCARGLDIKGVSHVVNFDMARDVEGYIHRIGRTGRAGATGISITFFNEAYDLECAPALAKIAREAGQPVPGFLERAAAKGAGKGKKLNKLWRY